MFDRFRDCYIPYLHPIPNNAFFSIDKLVHIRTWKMLIIDRISIMVSFIVAHRNNNIISLLQLRSVVSSSRTYFGKRSSLHPCYVNGWSRHIINKLLIVYAFEFSRLTIPPRKCAYGSTKENFLDFFINFLWCVLSDTSTFLNTINSGHAFSLTTY